MSSQHGAQSAAGDDDAVNADGESIRSGNMSDNSNDNPSANEGCDDENNDAGEEEEDEDEQSDPSIEPGVLYDTDSDDDDDDADAGECSTRRKAKSASKQCKECKECGKCQKKRTDVLRLWKEEVDRLKEEHADHTRRLKDRYKEEIKKLEDRIAKLEKYRPIVWKPWRDELFAFLEGFQQRDRDDDDREYRNRYHEIYEESYRQGNTSLTITHPDLHIVKTPYTQLEIEEHFADRGLHNPNNAALNGAFLFEKLPVQVQSKIWKPVVPNNELIHCLSRFDYFNPPVNDNLSRERQNLYPSRFHKGDEPCCVALADKPSTYLDYLCVSKRWYYVLAHLFYGTNTFAFSSLGELGRFCHGIGRARTERLVHVELMWQGRLTPRQPKGKISLRKEPLHHFLFTSRLRTLLVHIDESGKTHMRRSYEMKIDDDYYEDFGTEDYATHEAEDEMDKFLLEAQRTDLHQNFRKYRGMRTTHGMDFIYQLRGMKWVKFYDTHAEKPRTLIRDKSFLSDINNTTTTRKSDSMALKSELDNLRPLTLLEDFIPDDQTAELVAGFYDDTPVDDVPVAGSDTSSSSSDSDSDDDDDDDSSSGYSSGSNSSRLIKGYDPKSKNSTSKVGGGDDMDDDGDESRPGDASEPIVIPDDNDNRRRRRGRDRDISSSDELFVRSGSCTAHTDVDSDDDDEVTVVTQSSSFVDLTLDDDDGEDSTMKIDDADTVLKEEDEIKSEIILDDDDDEEVLFVKPEEASFQGFSPNMPDSSSDASSQKSLKRSPSEDNMD